MDLTDEDRIVVADVSNDTPPPVRELSRPQRRVLGVLLEKAFTTPDAYPLTLKAVTSGCNQKSNRAPVTNDSEDAVENTLEELRKLGLVAVVHTESSRTERFRHFMRKRYPFNEPQLAIITELLLRGRQQLGELRSRASRMVPIESQAELRDHLQGLAADEYIVSDGPLERRGVEVDHGLYPAGEAPAMSAPPTSTEAPDLQADVAEPVTEHRVAPAPSSPVDQASPELTQQLAQMRSEIEDLREQLSRLSDEMTDLKRDLGV